MRRVPLLILLLLALVPATASAATSVKAPGILYALDAKGAIVTKSGGTFRLSMPANTPVTWFTDRPDRKAGSVRLIDLYGIWDASGFNTDPPNAALLTTHEGVEHTHVVEMTKPEFLMGRVSFAIRAVKNGKEAGHVQTHDLAAGRFGRARLFIDDAALNPCPATIGSTVQFSPSTPTVTQCLLAPSATTKFSWPSISWGYTLVQACSTGTTSFYMPNFAWGKVYAPVCATSTVTDPLIVSRGYSTPLATGDCWPDVDQYGNQISVCFPGYPDGTQYCPTPTKGYYWIGIPATAPAALRITVTDGKNLICPQVTMSTFLKIAPTTTVGP